jgi:hypothetical protein
MERALAVHRPALRPGAARQRLQRGEGLAEPRAADPEIGQLFLDIDAGLRGLGSIPGTVANSSRRRARRASGSLTPGSGHHEIDQIVADRGPLQELLEVGLAEGDVGLGLEQGIAAPKLQIGLGRDLARSAA